MSSLCEKCVLLFFVSPASSRLQSCKCVPWIFRTSGEMKQKQVMPSNILGGGFIFFVHLYLGKIPILIFQRAWSHFSSLADLISRYFKASHLSRSQFLRNFLAIYPSNFEHWYADLEQRHGGGGEWSWSFLGGGFKRFLFSPLFWEDSHFD